MLLIPKQPANASDTEAAILDFKIDLSVYNDTVPTKIYDKRDVFILILLIFRSLNAMSLGVLLMVYIHIYFNLFSLSEYHRMLMTSIIVTNL